jgi:hypothetical protein
VCYALGVATLKVEGVTEDLLCGLRVEAAARRRSVRELVIEELERVVNGRPVPGEAEQAPAEPKIPGAAASPRARSARLGLPRAKKQARKEQGAEIERFSGDVTPCRHGLIFHPGCNA